MARKRKVGIEYFSHDVDLMQDTKIKILKAKHGLLGYAVFLRLLEELYRENGYYLHLTEDFNILFSDDNNLDFNVYISILNDCINKNLFDKQLYEKYHILTSTRVQENYCSATERRKEVFFFSEYLLINLDGKFNKEKVNVNINPLNVNINSSNVNISTQSKVKEKESILKQTKSKDTKPNKISISEKIKNEIDTLEIERSLKYKLKEFVDYRLEIKDPLKTMRSIKAMINKIGKDYKDYDDLCNCIDTSISNGYKGVFPNKNNNMKPKSKNRHIEELEQMRREEQTKDAETV
jgi:hypothetical protein